MYPRDTVLRAFSRALEAKPHERLEKIAASAGVSPNTLKRALNGAGTSFRFARARALLGAIENAEMALPPRSRKQIAEMLGFPSPSALSHFIQRGRIPPPPPAARLATAKIEPLRPVMGWPRQVAARYSGWTLEATRRLSQWPDC